MEKKKKMQIESTTLNEVPADERKSWWQVAFIEMGIYICVPCLMLGGMMINGMTLKNAVIAALAGYILAAVIMSFSGMMGADYGSVRFPGSCQYLLLLLDLQPAGQLRKHVVQKFVVRQRMHRVYSQIAEESDSGRCR